MKTDRQYHFAGIIPARYASSRFPGKPLALIGNKPMIQMVYEQAGKSLDLVYVATDYKRIYDCVSGFDGKALMTSPHHKSGTDRCAEAVTGITVETGKRIDIVINIQGDEPFIRDSEKSNWTKKHVYYKHIGLYGYRTETLKKITLLAPSLLEISESLEQNRWIENGYRIKTAVTLWENTGIDTPDDLEKAKLLFSHIS